MLTSGTRAEANADAEHAEQVPDGRPGTGYIACGSGESV